MSSIKPKQNELEQYKQLPGFTSMTAGLTVSQAREVARLLEEYDRKPIVFAGQVWRDKENANRTVTVLSVGKKSWFHMQYMCKNRDEMDEIIVVNLKHGHVYNVTMANFIKDWELIDG